MLTVAEALAQQGGVAVEWALGATSQVAAPDVAASRRKAALSLAARSDVVVAVLGDDSESSSEWGDRDSIDLPGNRHVTVM